MDNRQLSEALIEINHAQSLDELKQIEIKWLGKNGIITKALREYGQRQAEARTIERRLEELDEVIKERWNQQYLKITGKPGGWE